MTFHPVAVVGSPRWRSLDLMLAPYAIKSSESKGRRRPEGGHPFRSPFMRDRDRILHSAAFRRLMNKTQVYVGPNNDHLRTRLTHTLEVAQIARTAARALGLNEDLVEAIALVHDIGHPPFGHAGERALRRLLAEHGGFEHNKHALDRIERLERYRPEFRGLNLTFEVLDAVACRSKAAPCDAFADFRGGMQASAECQLVDLCDSIAYDAHDIDDALRAGLLVLDDLIELELWKEASHRAGSSTDFDDPWLLARRASAILVDAMATSLITESAQRLAPMNSPAEVQDAPAGSIAIEESRRPAKKQLERFLFDKVYRHPQVLEATAEAERIVERLFAAFTAAPSLLAPAEQARLAEEPVPIVVSDYIAGMTDRFARRRDEELRTT
jgi:dGTPase